MLFNDTVSSTEVMLYVRMILKCELGIICIIPTIHLERTRKTMRNPS